MACIKSYVQQLCCGQWCASRHIYNSYVVVSGVHHVICKGYAVTSGVHDHKCRVMLWSVACMMSNVELCCDK